MAKQTKQFDSLRIANKKKEQIQNKIKTILDDKIKSLSILDKNMENTNTSSIAKFETERILDLNNSMKNTSLILSPLKKDGFAKVDEKVDSATKAIYKTLNEKNFFDDIQNAFGTDKVQSPSKFYEENVIKFDKKNPIHLNKSNGRLNTGSWTNSYNSLNKFQNIKKNGGHLITFDTETVPGVDSINHNSLDYITEISATVHELKGGQMNVARRIDTVLGFDEEQYNKALNRLKHIKKNGMPRKGSNDRVFFDRMNIYSTAKTRQDGFEVHIDKADGIDDIETSFAKAEAGIENLRKIGKQQEAWGLENVGKDFKLKEANKQYVKNVADLISTGSYKGTAYNGFVSLGQNSSMFDIPHIETVAGTKINTSNHIDLYQLNMAIQDNLGANELLPKGIKSSGKFGRATQENLSSSMGYKVEGKAAHIAITDEEELARMFVQPLMGDKEKIAKEFKNGKYEISNNSYFEFLKKQADKVNTLLEPTKSVYESNNQIFYMDYTQQKNWADKKGSLSFAVDPTSNKVKTFDGYEIGSAINNTGYNQYGARKGTLVTHDVVKVNTKEDLKKMFSNIDGLSEAEIDSAFKDIVNAKELYLVKTQEYVNKDLLEKRMGKDAASFFNENLRTVYTIETNRERLEASLGIHVANKDGSIVEKAINDLGLSKVSQTGSDITVETLTGREAYKALEDKNIDRIINDSAARKIREAKYSHIKKMVDFEKRHASESLKNPLAHHALKYSEAVTNGPIDLTIQNELGYVDFNTGQKKIAPETVRNSVAMESYVQALMETDGTNPSLFDEFESILDSKYGKFDLPNYDPKNPIQREQYLKREMGFKQLLNDYVVEARTGLNNGGVYTKADLNKIDFSTSQMFPKQFLSTVTSSSNEVMDDITTLDLNKNDSLLNMFFNDKFGIVADRTPKDGNAGWQSLSDAYKKIKADDRFKKGLWTDLDIDKLREEGYSVYQVNDMMMADLKNFVNEKRQSDKGFGLLHPRNNMSVIDKDDINSLIKIDANKRKDIIKNISENLRDDSDIILANGNEALNKKAINKLVDEYFMGYSEDEFKKSLKGYTSHQKEILTLQHKLNKNTAKTYAEDLVNAISNDAELALRITKTKNGAPILSLVEGSKVTNLNAQRFVLNKGISTSEIGGNEYVNRLALRMLKANGQETPIITSTAERAVRLKSMDARIKWAKQREGSVAEAIIGAVKDRSKEVAEATSRVEFSNGQLFAQAFELDTNEVLAMLPTLQRKGVLDKLDRELDIDETTRKVVRQLSSDINSGKKILSTKAYSDILPRELNHFESYYPGILKELNEYVTIPGIDIEEQDKYVEAVLGAAKQKTKTTAFRTGKDSLDFTYYMDAFAAFDNEHRPPMSQMANTVLYDKKKINEGIEDLGKLGIKAKRNPVATNSLAEKFLYENTSKAGKEFTATSGLSLKFLQIDSYSLQNKFIKDEEDFIAKKTSKMANFLKGKGFSDKAAETMFERLTSLSTYEQQALINSRVSDVAYHKINTQKINATKDMIFNMNNDLETIANIKNYDKLQFKIVNGEIVYSNGIAVKAGDTLGRFGNDEFSSAKIARYDGIFRGRFFDEHNNVVNATDINKMIKGMSENDAIDFLNNNFSYKYEVMPTKEMHGMKVFLGASEKATTDSLKMGVGTLDTELKKDLEKYGLQDIVGTVPYADYLYGDVKDKLYQSKEGQAIFNRILEERHALSDYMQLDEQLKGKGVISAVNINKHNSSSMLLHSFMNDLQDAGMINKENMDAIFGEGNYSLLDGNRVMLSPKIKTMDFNFNGNEDLKKVFDSTLEKFKKGEGMVTVTHGQDDIAGTLSGVEDGTVNRQLNQINREINGLERTYKRKEDIIAKKVQLQNEKEELQQIIANVDSKVKTQKQNMQEILDDNIKTIQEHLLKSDVAIEQETKRKNNIYNQIQEKTNKIAELKKSPKEEGKYDILNELMMDKENLRNEYLGSQIYLNNLYDERAMLIDDLKANKNKGFKTTEDIDIRLKHFDRLDEINRFLNKESSTNIDEMKEQLISLKKRKLELEKMANTMDNYKGVKFSNAMGSNLDRTTFNEDLFNKLKTELDSETFEKYYGYALDGGVIKDEFKGKSLSQPITNKLRKDLILKEGSLTVGDIMDDEYLKEQYGYLHEAITKNGGNVNDISLEKAENMYSYIQGSKAMKFNESPQNRIARKELMSSSLGQFKTIDYKDLELDIAGQGRTIVNSPNNPYTNNLIIKTGLSGDYADLAIARMPEVHAGEGLIKRQHVQRLNTLKEKLDIFHNAEDEVEKSKAEIKVKQEIDYIKKLQKADITSKTGLIREGQELRMSQSFFGKASGININSYKDNVDLFGILKGDADSVEKMIDNGLDKKSVINKLELNNSRLKDKMFGGKSLLEHYAEGRLIDSAFVSESTFRRLGYFDKDVLEKTFSNLSEDYAKKLEGFALDTKKGREDAMRHLLSTEGDSFLTVRYPEIMEGSDKFGQVYLDKHLKDNEIMVMGATGMSAKLDHDGDQFAAALVKDEFGNSKLMANIMGDTESLTQKAFDASIITRSTTNNLYWETKVKDHIMNEAKFASSVDSLKSIAGKRAINGKIYTSLLDDPTLTMEQLKGYQEKYKSILRKDEKNYKNMSPEEEKSLIDDITKISGKSEEEALNEYMAAWAFSDNQDMITAKVYQNAVGETNITNQKIKNIVSGMIDKNDEAYEYKQNILGDFLYRAEEGAISSKSSVEGLEPDRAKEWNDAATNVIKGNNVEKNQKVMKEWLQKNVQDQAFIESYYARSSHFSNYIKDNYNINNFHDFKNLLDDKEAKAEIMEKVTNDVVDTISSVNKQADKHEVARLLDTLKAGTSQTGASSKTILNPLFINGQDSNYKSYLESAQEHFGMEHFDIENMKTKLEQSRISQEFRDSVENIVSDVGDDIKKVSTDEKVGNIIEGVEGFAKSLKGKNLAIGAVGIAAAVMTAGYLGGRPRPAETQAMEEAQDYPEGNVPLADPQMVSRGPQQGYVVNINARTNKGKKHAIQALQQAISSGTSSSINISMNIKDNYGNINDRDLEEAIMGAF